MSFDKNYENISDNEKIDQNLIINPKLTQHDSQSNKKGKQILSNEPCYVHQLSVELITHVFSRLDPSSLAVASRVCAYWRNIINDDNCWRDAFISYFGCLPLKRLSTESWKAEYILRNHLMRKWKRGRGMIMTFNPKIGSLDTMNVDFEGSNMIVASSEQGVAAKCNPMTGKVSQRHLLFSTHENIRLELSSVKVDDSRILWGSPSGYITLTTRTKTTSQLKVFSGFHAGPIRILATAPSNEIILSGADDGIVKLWDVITTSCCWSLHPVTSTLPVSIEATSDHRVIVGYDNGSVAIWKFDFSDLIQTHRLPEGHRNYGEKINAIRRKSEEEKIMIEAPLSKFGDHLPVSVSCMSYDAKTQRLLVGYKGTTDVFKYDVNTGRSVGLFSHGHNAGRSITSMNWDTSPITSTLTLESAIKPKLNSKNKKTNTIIDLSSANAKSGGSSGQNTPGSTLNSIIKTTRLLVTGDDLGSVCLWNGDDVSEEGGGIRPIRVLHGHTVGISTIFIDACKVVTGSDDGWIRIWDPLTGENINTLGNKIPKGAPVDRTDINMMRVKNLYCNDYQGVATIGHQVKTWDFSPTQQFLNRKTLRGKGKACNNVTRDRIKYEIGKEVKESIEKLEIEKEERERRDRLLNKLSLGGLTDEEMLEYGLMLSEQEKPVDVISTHQTDFIDVDDEDLMKAVIASLSLTEATNKTQDVVEEFYEDQYEEEYEDWPTLNESAVGSFGDDYIDDDDMDEDLKYVLQLSKTEK